jgi:tetratricopeptide (TPR) repeat protein
LSAAIFACTAAPFSGAPRSWGLYAPAGACITIYAVWWLMNRVENTRQYRAVVLGAAVLSLMHLLPALYVSTDPDASTEILVVNASSSTPWDVRGRADALEQLSAMHLAKGDTLTAAVRLTQAWDARPNPLYLGVAGTYYANTSRFSLAEKEFARLVAVRPNDVEANLSLGILLAVRRDMEGAKRFLLIAYGDTTFSLPEPKMDTSADWENMPKGPERERLIRGRASRRFAASAAFVKGDDAARRGLLDAAMRQYEQALSIYPRWGKMQFEAHTHVATIHAMQGRFREAAREMLLGVNSYRNYATCYYIVNGVGYGPVRPAAAAIHAPLPTE